MENIIENLQKIKQASKYISNLSIENRNKIIYDIWKAIIKNKDIIKEENLKDLIKLDKENPMYDRLLLTDTRIESMSKWCYELIDITDPLDKFKSEEHIVTKDSITIKKVWVPLWVVACIYESRPNVTIDLIIMCIKSWNAVILRWWKEALNSNKILIQIVKYVLKQNQIDENIIYNYPISREELNIMFEATDYIDVIIPRWWKSLIDSVRKNSIVPVIETWAWVVHIYLDNEIENNTEKAIDLIINAKVSRPSVCNALDTLIINKHVSKEIINKLFSKLEKYWVKILNSLNNNDYHIEQLSLNLNIKYVNNLDEAIKHIDTYSSKHSDWIITENKDKIKEFYSRVDSAVVYTNTSTRFSDWSCFWLGWEIWISTQKLHSRWPMWAESLVTYKYIIDSDFKIRE